MDIKYYIPEQFFFFLMASYIPELHFYQFLSICFSNLLRLFVCCRLHLFSLNFTFLILSSLQHLSNFTLNSTPLLQITFLQILPILGHLIISAVHFLFITQDTNENTEQNQASRGFHWSSLEMLSQPDSIFNVFPANSSLNRCASTPQILLFVYFSSFLHESYLDWHQSFARAKTQHNHCLWCF